MATYTNAGTGVSSSRGFLLEDKIGSSQMDFITQNIETGKVTCGLITLTVVNMAPVPSTAYKSFGQVINFHADLLAQRKDIICW